MNTIQIRLRTETTHDVQLPLYFRNGEDYFCILNYEQAYEINMYSYARKGGMVSRISVDTAKVGAGICQRITRNEFMKKLQDCRAEFMANYTQLLEEDNAITANMFEYEDHADYIDTPLEEDLEINEFPDFTENH